MSGVTQAGDTLTLPMVPDAVFYRDLADVFVAAVLGGVLARRARQPLILGYVVGGILVSPLTPGPAVTDIHHFELFAEIGVILLMFSIGIELAAGPPAREVGRDGRWPARHPALDRPRPWGRRAPSPDAVIQPGDRVLVFGLREQIAAFEREARIETDYHVSDDGVGGAR